MRSLRMELFIVLLLYSVFTITPTASSVQESPQLVVLSRTDTGYSVTVQPTDGLQSYTIAEIPSSSQSAFVEMMPAHEIEAARAFLASAGATTETVTSLMQSHPNTVVDLLTTSPDGQTAAAVVRYESCVYGQRTCFGRSDLVLLSKAENRTIFTLGSTGDPSVFEFEGVYTSRVRIDDAEWLPESDAIVVAASSEISRQNAQGSILIAVSLDRSQLPTSIARALNWGVSAHDGLLISIEDVDHSTNLVVREIAADSQLRTSRRIPLGDIIVDQQLRLGVLGRQVLFWKVGSRTSVTAVGGLVALDIEGVVPDLAPIYSRTYVSRIVPLTQPDTALIELADGQLLHATLTNRVFNLVDPELPRAANWWLAPDGRSVLLQTANGTGFAVYDVSSGSGAMVEIRSGMSVDSTSTIEVLW